MCTHQRLIHSPYMKRPMYVDCGHCEACLQKKANKRTRRIRNTYDDSLCCLMVSLTYSRFTAPYIDRNEAYDFSRGRIPYLNVYRDCSVRKVRKPSNWDDYHQVYKVTNETVTLGKIDFVDFTDIEGTKDLSLGKDGVETDKIGVCFYKDYQDFAARFRLNLKRHYKYDGKLLIYATSELGSRSLRPHFHLLVFGNKADKEKLRSAVYESWPFSNLRRFPRAVEESYRASSYVASYVNSGSKFPKFFKNYFKPKHSYSKGFGLSNRQFSLSQILEKFEQGSLKFGVLKNQQGCQVVDYVPIPAYVVHRYFPKFKTYTRIPPSTLVENMCRIGRFDFEGFNKSVAPLYLDETEFYKINIRLHNAFKRFVECCPEKYRDISFRDYYSLHKSVWSCYNSTLLRLQMENDDIPLEEHFDNLDEFLYDDRGKEFLRWNGIEPEKVQNTNPNLFRSVMNHTEQLKSNYYEHIKHRNVSAAVYALADSSCEL